MLRGKLNSKNEMKIKNLKLFRQENKIYIPNVLTLAGVCLGI